MNKTRAVFYDLDNTLYPQETDIIQRIDSCIRQFALEPKAEIRKYWITAWKDNGPKKPGLVDEILREFSLDIRSGPVIEHYRSLRTRLELPVAHQRLLEVCRSKGIRQFLITNGNSITQQNKIRALRIGDFFDRMVVSRGRYAKPSRFWFRHLMGDLNPADCISVGDWYAVDGIASRDAGIPFIHVAGGPVKEIIPQGIPQIADLAELERYLVL